MPSTTTYRFGDVVLVPFPFSDQTDIKRRPTIVVSSAAYHKGRTDLILMAVTSQVHRANRIRIGEVLIAKWREAGLARPSVAKPVLITMDRRLVIRRLGHLQGPDRQAVRRSLTTVLEVA